MSGVYAIRHFWTGQRYIGSSRNIEKRFAHHRELLRNGSHTNSALQAAWDADGEDSFAFEVVERCSAETLLQREQAWLDRYVANRFNVVPVADRSRPHTYEQTAEAKARHAQRAADRSLDRSLLQDWAAQEVTSRWRSRGARLPVPGGDPRVRIQFECEVRERAAELALDKNLNL